MGRVFNLDYLRGLSAFGIMIYHFLGWNGVGMGPTTFIGRVGIYGVSLFYILSGLTLFHVYSKKIYTMPEVATFFKKRFFRIYPLLWLATICTLILSLKAPDPGILFLNLTGLFGLVRWDSYYAVGAWSIGNELVFYVAFPLLMYLIKKSRTFLVMLALVMVLIHALFAFWIIDDGSALEGQWRNYVNPLNQVFFFFGGILVGLIFEKVKLTKTTTFAILLMGGALFAFFPANPADAVYLVTGVHRMVFTFACLLICLGFYKLEVRLPSFADRALAGLGEASYSVYLLHPLVYGVVAYLSNNLVEIAVPSAVLLAISVTLVASFIVYQRFEKYFMKLAVRTSQVPPHP